MSVSKTYKEVLLQNLTSSTLALSDDIFIFDSEPNTYCHAVCSQPCYIAEVGFSHDFPVCNFGDPLLMTKLLWIVYDLTDLKTLLLNNSYN